jgi:hypothetical protein
VALPTNGTAVQIAANRLTNKELALRIEHIRDNRLSYTKAEADAFLNEAVKRLGWADNYVKHETTNEARSLA